MIGPPIMGRALEGDEPQRHHAAAHRRLALSWSVELPVEMKAMVDSRARTRVLSSRKGEARRSQDGLL
jgi:hypothetical protein